MPALPDPQSIPSLPPTAQTAVLDALFEPSPTLHALMQPALQTPFPSYPALITACHSVMHSLRQTDTPRLHAILGAHPRLGAPKVDSAQSAAEQARLQQGSEATRVRLAELNQLYEQRFPGLRYVVFVNGRGREEIMRNMEERIERGDIGKEEEEAIQAMCDIANDRAKKLLAASPA
ncbi:hypothetical protein TD95_003874 [Thielaviopsis punctulata]|uniref:Oxo-4-hydroxy-4-carboxy-5-ureidoimidazoline decarboxylase domain-containing protein n=1 Tax=Thielaviopsis punctulata TaxID=72032 RepID=A0A0F4ZI44_9PEZI|nr:hypothetical protein TD95_003874 [Thielaviopsis punctulata]